MRVALPAAGLWLCLSAIAQADAGLDEPLSLSNRSPLIQVYGLPGARSGAVLGTGETALRLGYDVANNFTRSQRGSESIELDGETQRLELGLRQGLGRGWEVGLTLPLLRQDGGGLDGFIEHWHNFWGLPDGGRPGYPRNRLNYRYARDGRSGLDFSSTQSGVGDLELNAAYSLLSAGDDAVALAAVLHLPTGDADKLTGSGATNASLMLAATHNHLWNLPLTVTGNLGVMWLDRGDVLGDYQKDAVGFGSLELGWAVADSWRLKAQLDGHTAFYDSSLRELGADSLQLLLGGTARLSAHWLVDVAVAEDIAVDTAPDVVFQLALRARY